MRPIAQARLQGTPLTGTGNGRNRSFSRLTAYEAARILTKIGADVRVFDPAGLPVKDDVSEAHPKVQELRALSQWCVKAPAPLSLFGSY